MICFVVWKSIFRVFLNVYKYIVTVLYFVLTSIAGKYFVFDFNYFL